MVNLLSRSRDPDRFPALDPTQHARIRERSSAFAGRDWRGLAARAAHAFEELEVVLAAELEELEASPTLSTAQVILARLDVLRAEVLAGGSGSGPRGPAAYLASQGDASVVEQGHWLCYRPGRSLGSGEAEVASRGFFDVRDRPPLCLWIDAIARSRAPGSDVFEIGVLCWVPGDAVERARAGRKHCVSGALSLFEEVVAGSPPDRP